MKSDGFYYWESQAVNVQICLPPSQLGCSIGSQSETCAEHLNFRTSQPGHLHFLRLALLFLRENTDTSVFLHQSHTSTYSRKRAEGAESQFLPF